ncbi:unnamed protein product, partial [Rotaria sp. Silwood2]
MDSIRPGCVSFCNKIKIQNSFSYSNKVSEEFDDLSIIKNVVKKLISKVCRLDNERKRQSKNRKKQKEIRDFFSNEEPIAEPRRPNNRFNKSNSDYGLFHKQQSERSRRYYRNKYQHNTDFRRQEQARLNVHVSLKYNNNINFREKMKTLSKIHHFNKYHTHKVFREKVKARSKSSLLNKYYNNIDFRKKLITQSKNTVLNKYYNSIDFRNKVKRQSNMNILNKYHTNSDFRNKYKANMKNQVLIKYYTDNSIRLKMIQNALKSYRNNNTVLRRNSRRIYNQGRRILKKYTLIQSHKCTVKHRNLYLYNLNRFRQIIQEGPDYVCISCRLALFRNQVIPFVVEKYIKENMSYEIKEHIQSYFMYSSSREQKWICKSCSDKIKKRQMPSRAIVNKLKVCDVPSELKKLNNLEKHLIALRLPFMKIVNLTSGKLSSRFSQKGTKGPLHCVPSDVEDTVTTLPRPVDKSMMVRLQLKRRLNYKAIWEEQLVNPNDVRDALFVLTKMHPGYKSIKINDIHENYLTSDQEKNYDNNVELVVEPMDVETISKETVIEQTEVFNENNLKRLALGDIDNTIDSDEEINEDGQDIRTKYNIGTDSCTQPCDFNDFLVFDK